MLPDHRRVFKASKSRLGTSAFVDDEASDEDASGTLYPPGRDMLSALEDYLDAYEAKEATTMSEDGSPRIPAKRCQDDEATMENTSKRLRVPDGSAAQTEGVSRWKLRVNERSKRHRKGLPSNPKVKVNAEGVTYIPVTEEPLGSRPLSGQAVESKKEDLPCWMYNDMLEIVD
ncbi:MAG: hypothetical protein Q9183_003287 [Haloplaca sp. 2 TL-2023]